MIQPVVIPYGPISPFQTHMPQQMRPQVPQQTVQMPHPMETLRPPMPSPLMAHQHQHQPQPQVQVQQEQQAQGSSQPIPIFPPNPFIQHLAQQILNQRMRMEIQRAQEEAQQEQSQREEIQVPQKVLQGEMQSGEVVMAQRIPIPEEVLRQINRLPNHEVIVSVSEQEPEETPQELRIIQHPRQSAQEMNGRQAYAKGLPVHIPVPMMQQQEVQETQDQQEPQQVVSNEEIRPHCKFILLK